MASRKWISTRYLFFTCLLLVPLALIALWGWVSPAPESASAPVTVTLPAPAPTISALPTGRVPLTPPPDLWATPPPELEEPPLAAEPAATPEVSLPPMVIPVVGVRLGQLRDTYSDARSEGRVHNALDIMAPHGATVVAAADGELVKFMWSDRGGNTIYQLSPDRKTVYYYAHLDSYADGLAEKQTVRRGDVIGYVGDTGNSGTGNYHLHFAVWLVTDPKRYWDGENINPYPLLSAAEKETDKR